MNIFTTNVFFQEVGLLIIRVGIGLIFVVHGYFKLVGGMEQWLWLGNQMTNLGITFLPVVWGFLAVCAEFFGGIALVLGLGTRIAAFFIACVMLVALVMHLTKGDVFSVYSQPLSILFVCLGLVIAGGGKYALDLLIS